jgi:hypothetical protein
MSYSNVLVWWVGVCLLPIAATAQDSAGEVGVRYAYNSVGASASIENGDSVYGEYFLKGTSPYLHGLGTFSLIADVSGSGSGSGSLYTYLFGIRFNTEWRKSHLVLHSEYKMGGAHVRVNGVNAAGGNVSFRRNSFAASAPGLGLDLRVGKHCVVTLLQIDFLGIAVPDLASGVSHWSGDLRVSGGIGFRFGKTR